MTRILITGGSGFAGRNLIYFFSKIPCEITATYRNHYPMKPISGVQYLKQDLSTEISIEGEYDAIIHTACSRPNCNVSTLDYVRDNIDTAREIVKYAKKMHIPKIVYFSTKNVYGQASNPIISEDADIINPDMYGLTKRVAESIFSEDKDIQTIGLRTPGIIGDGAHDIWLKSIAEKIIRNEDVSVSDFETRNLVDIDDIAQFIYQLITDKRFDEGYPYSVINLACEKKIHNRDIAEIIKKVSGSSSTITTHKAEDGLFVLDENKAREMGFRSSDPQKIVKRYIEGLIK